MATVKLLVGSALLLCELFLSTASAQNVDPNAPLPPPPTYGDGQPVYQPPPADGQPYAPQPGTYQPAPPPNYQPSPPPNYQPPQPGTYQPAPPPQSMSASPYPYRQGTRFRPQFGIGFRAIGLYTNNELLSYGQGGLNFDLMMRVHPRLTLEMSIGYHRTDEYDEYYSDYLRTDTPIILGMRIHPGPLNWPVSPYFVVGAGADIASADLPEIGESGVLGEVQGGGGLEIRLGKHFEFSLDLRGFGRFRPERVDQAYVSDYQGQPVRILGNQGGIMFNAGLGVFF